MCFITRKSSKLKTATEDILVYKVGVKSCRGESMRANCFHNHMYRKDERQPIVDLIKKMDDDCFDPNCRVIEEGYHSHKKVPSYVGRGKMIAEFIIPKGTHYYENKIQRVSETIIFKNFVISVPRDHNKRRRNG